jgi:hypothetical protein
MDVQRLDAFLQALKSVSKSASYEASFIELGDHRDLAIPVYQVSVSFICVEDGSKKFYSASVLFFGDEKAYAHLVTRSANREEGIRADKIDKAWLEDLDSEPPEEGEVCDEDGGLTWWGGYKFLITMIFMAVADSSVREEFERKLEDELRRVQATT